MNVDCVLDEEVWDRLAGIIRAAHEMDRKVFVVRARSFAEEVELPCQQRAGLCLWFLLRNALFWKVGKRVPTDAELARISRDYFARFRALVDADRLALEDTFRKVFERTPLREEISPGALLVLGLAVLGVLYEDPDAELTKMKPHLDSWWREHAEKFHSQGVLR